MNLTTYVDTESIIEKFNEKERQRTAVTITVCPQPSPRSNFSMTALPNSEMLMFGGEVCNYFNDSFI